MKAVLCKTHGPPENLVVEDVEEPQPGAGEVVVDIAFTGLNFFDTLIIENKYQLKPPLPFSPGAEFSGKVSAVGSGVSDLRVGQRVAGSSGHGACRAKLAVAADRLIPIPDNVSDEAGAGLMITYGTTIHALKQRADLKSGESLAVLGAAGGVGLAAVELGKLMGAKVIACASSPEKLAFAKKFGADETIDYSKADLKAELKRISGGKGVDVVYDPVGGPLAEAALRSVAWEGRFLVIGFASGEIPRIPLNLALLKGCDIRGVFWGEFTNRDPKTHRDNMQQVFEWNGQGKLSAHVHAVYPLAETTEALNVLKRREALGKVLIKM